MTNDNALPEAERRSGSEPFRPYARLISVLGDQLITSKWVGVIELVKNSYDADAHLVGVRFSGFDEPGQSQTIEIEDDGDGMTLDTILNVWMRPATPNKLNRKKSEEQRFTKLGRLMQGDKGVGRFAIYKLGNLVEILTKTASSEEISLTLNFRDYAQSDEFEKDEKFKHLFLDQVTNDWQINEAPIHFSGAKEAGTLIRVSDLRNDWKYEDLKKLYAAFQRMIPPVIPTFKEKIVRDFDVTLAWNDSSFSTGELSFEKVIDQAPFSFEGDIDERGKLTFIYRHNKKEIIDEIDLFDSDETNRHDVWKLPEFRKHFLEERELDEKLRVQKKRGEMVRPKKQLVVKHRPICGPCSFYFYAFDLRKNKHELTTREEEFVKDNSVYLYRDFTRVYPYGERSVDWLLLSKMRAEDRAGRYFSYNDLLGFVFISQEHNPYLRDQASREGLVNYKGAYDDFVALMQAGLKVMKDFVDVDKRKDEIRREKAFTSASSAFKSAFDALKRQLDSVSDEKSLICAQKLFKATNELVQQYKEKLTISEELAGLGMAVEKSSHDIFMLITKLIQNSNDIVKRFERNKLSTPDLRAFFDDLTESLEFLYQELQILQPLFRESRKSIKNVSIRETFERIARYYRREFQFDINFKLEGTSDLLVRTNLGLLLQVFINLIDNSVYWLKQKKTGKRQIIVRIDAENNRVWIADNGPGIPEDLAEVVFLEFYSTKADAGRGLGLYIAKELLARIDANISLCTSESLRILPGANFLIQFDEEK